MAKKKKSTAAAKGETPAEPSDSIPGMPDLRSLLAGTSANRAQWRSVVIRVRYLHHEMRAGRYPNSRHMKDRFGVERSTVGRDIEAMRDMGLPIAFDFKRNGYYYEHEVPADLPRPRMSPADALTFCLAFRCLQQFRGTGFADQLVATLRNLTREVEGPIIFEWDELDRFVSHGAQEPEPSAGPDFTPAIATALTGPEEIDVFYWSLKTAGHEWRRLVPLHLRIQEDTLYLLCRALDRDDDIIRAFVISRMADVRLTGRKSTRPADFDPDKFLKHSVGMYSGDRPERVRMRLNFLSERLLTERPLHSTQQIVKLPAAPAVPAGEGGSAAGDNSPAAPGPGFRPTAELTMDVAITPELERKLLTWGVDVEVLEPATLREKLLQTAREMVRRLEQPVTEGVKS